MKKNLFLIFLVICCQVNARNRYTATGDTNKTDANNRKQGIWSESVGESFWYGNYIDDVKEDVWIGYYGNGTISAVTHYRQGKKEGASISLDRGGCILKEEYYKNDSLNGPSKTFTQPARL